MKKEKPIIKKNGIKIVDDIYRYLISYGIHYKRYDHKNKLAELSCLLSIQGISNVH